MLNRYIRYFPVINILKSDKPRSILEVGSGELGLSEFYGGSFTGCDLIKRRNIRRCFSRMKFVNADIRSLPFRAREFDLVICLDVLEHLENKDLGNALEELMRVTKKKLIVGAPMGRVSFITDRLIYLTFKILKRDVPIWLNEHKGKLLRKKEVLKTLKEKNCSCKTISNESVFLHYWTILLDYTFNTDFLVEFIRKNSNFKYMYPFLNYIPYRRIIIVEKND